VKVGVSARWDLAALTSDHEDRCT